MDEQAANVVLDHESERKVDDVLQETAVARESADIFLATRFEGHLERIAAALEKIAGSGRGSPAWETLMRERRDA